ncbi:hypothetical protein Mapa_001171 [Marchantia paleacea]|nr:hypothetical protein Mapa_001171 [Marchantia paleacea]
MPLGEANLFGLTEFDNKESFFSGKPILPQGVGYAVVVGYGAFFVLLTGLLSFLDQRYGGTKDNSEEFNTAGRSIKTGLIAVDVVSRWTWVATLTVSVNEAYTYGVSGPFWFSAAAAIQLIVFAIIALEVKRKAPKAHTVVELIRLRWGHPAAFVYMYLCYLNNLCIAILLFIGAGAILTAVTGMNLYATLVLLPLGVIIYTFGGGLKATFTSSYLHTIIIFITVNIMFFVIYGSNNSPVGTIADVYNNLQVVSEAVPVQDNKEGSYLTMYSSGGLQFGIWNLVGAFGTIFADQGYWQGAIAATPRSAYRGYILGGLLWIPIPFAFSTALGLGALAADLPISNDEYGAGLICVAAAQFFMGTGGVVLILTVVFMSVTSAGSAQFMAMSSLFTYDVYKTYINPKATDHEMLTVSRASVCAFGLLIGALACLCVKVGIDVNFLFFVDGILLASSYIPIGAMVMWKDVPAGAAIASALAGQAVGVTVWLSHVWIVYKRFTVKDTMQRMGPTLSGTCAAVAASLVILCVWTWIRPTKDDYLEKFKQIELMDGVVILDTPDKDSKMHPWFNKYTCFALPLSFVLLVVWPLLTLPADIFSQGYFTFWVILAAVWTIIATVVATVQPLVEARRALFRVIGNMLGLPMGSKPDNSVKPLDQAQEYEKSPVRVKKVED